MINKLIENYINTMTIDDVNKFAMNNNVSLSNDELTIIYSTIKNNWYDLIYGNYSSIFNELKNKISPSTYKKAEELFFYFKNKYQRFL